MYTDRNFKTKKELKAAVEAYNTLKGIDGERAGRAVTYHQPGPFGGNEPKDGTIYLEGPHCPAAHSWYAKAVVKDGKVVSVK
jgi:hypothetical protein